MTLGDVVKITQPFRLNIENADPCSDPHSNLAGIGASYPCSEDDHLGRRNTRGPTEEDSSSSTGWSPGTSLQQGWKLAQQSHSSDEGEEATHFLLNGFITNPDNPALQQLFCEGFYLRPDGDR